MKHIQLIVFIIFCCLPAWSYSQMASYKVAKLKYNGGGDWYANPSSMKNLFNFIKQNSRTNIHLEEEITEPSSAQIFQYPMLYITGHGNIELSSSEAENLRKYLSAGGFLLIDDNYGLQKFARREMKKVFPDLEFQEIPLSHPIYQIHYKFPKGLPKIHEHDGKPAQAFGLFLNGRLVCMLTFESDLGDGWEDKEVHNDNENTRQLAFQMGTNILFYAIGR